eukprot:1159032-Alexandrium_andersonii.AAC.1
MHGVCVCDKLGLSGSHVFARNLVPAACGLPSGLVTLLAWALHFVRGPSGWVSRHSRVQGSAECGCPLCSPRVGQCGEEG